MRVGRAFVALAAVVTVQACAEKPGSRADFVVLTRDSSLVAVTPDGASTHLMDGVESFTVSATAIVATGRSGMPDRKLGARSTYSFQVDRLAKFERAEPSAAVAQQGDQPDARFKVAGDTLRWSGADGVAHEMAGVKAFRIVPVAASR